MRFLSFIHAVTIRFMLANWALSNHAHLWKTLSWDKARVFPSRLEALLAFCMLWANGNPSDALTLLLVSCGFVRMPQLHDEFSRFGKVPCQF